MRVWRISNYRDWSGRGGILARGRWNKQGTPVVYCSDHPATALLEMLAHINRFRIPDGFLLLSIDVLDSAPTTSLGPSELPRGWRSNLDTTRAIGTRLLDDTAHLAIRVPCALVPHAWNILLNPRHPDIVRCSVVETIESAFDPRLIR